jgi:hypothetical protein
MAQEPKGNQAIPSSSAVPDSNTLLAYKLLSDSWASGNDGNIFNQLMKEEMKYLVSGISLLQNDPYLQVKLGGVNLNNAGYLASALKSKVAELELRERIEPNARELLTQQYSDENLQSLAPNVANGSIKNASGILNINLRDNKGKISSMSTKGSAITTKKENEQ